ncbi:MAG: MFS transporter [Chloroflexota bacterium]|nr:MFS transporter [Chloroflexota bacterium]
MSRLPGRARNGPDGAAPDRSLAELSETPLRVLRNRRFLALWLAQVATQVGTNMVLFGLTVQIFTVTRQSTSISLLILSFLVPAVIFGAIAGVYVDRQDRRMLLVATNALRAVLFVGLIFVQQDVALIYLFTILISTLTTFFGPAEAAMIPVIVDRRQLLAANSMYVFTLQASFFVGFAILGPLVVNLYDLGVLLWIVAALFFAAAALCWTLPPHNPRLGAHRPAQALSEAGSAVATTFAQLRDGLRFIADNRNVFWPLTYLAITASLIGVLGVLGPGFATQVLGLTERDFVIVVLPLGAGLVMGILLLNAYGRFIPRRRGVEGGLVALGVTLAALAVAQPVTTVLTQGVISLLSVVVVVAFAAGIAYAFVAVPAQTQLQEELPPDVRGRVFGVLNMLISIASFLPIILVGPIADVVGTSPVVLVSALFVLLAAAGSIAWARPARPAATSPAALLEPIDPVAVTSRSLTQPVRLRYVDEEREGAVGLSYLSSPVIPGRAGPAHPTEHE